MAMRLRDNKLFFFLLCISFLQLDAQQYGYVQYNKGAESPFNEAYTVLQDSLGYIWIGSDNGLFRFDGIHYDNFSIHTESQSIHQLQLSNQQLLFANDKGLYKLNTRSDQPKLNPIIEATLQETDSLPFYPNDFIFSKDKCMWVSQSNHSIGKWKDGNFKTYYFSRSSKQQKLSIEEDTNGNIWVLSPLDGLFLYDNKTDRFEKKLAITNGQALVVQNKQLIIGNDALHIFSLLKNDLRLIKQITLEDDMVTTIHVAKNNNLYYGTAKGDLFKLKDINTAPQVIYGANEAHRVEKLNFGHINQIYSTPNSLSNANKLWISSKTGLWHLQKRFFKTVDNLPMNNPIGITLNSEGKAWIPINYLFEVSKEKDGYTAKPVLNNLQVNSVAAMEGKTLWVSTNTPKIQLLKYKNKQLIKRYDFSERGESIFYLYPDSKGNLWFNQAPIDKPIIGTALIDTEGKVKFYDETKGFSSRILALKESKRGEIFAVGIGEESYLYRFDSDKDRFINLSPKLPFTPRLNFEAHDLTIDDRGLVWLATTDGLLRYDGEKIVLIKNDILDQEEVRGVTHYASNVIWVATATNGLVYHQGNTSTLFGESEGLPAIISSYRCITTDRDGRLWAGTAEGLVYSRVSASQFPYSHTPKIREVLINRNEPVKSTNSLLRLKYGNHLEFHFTNLSYPAKNVQYQYRLLNKENRDILLEEQHWETISTKNVLKLNNIELGDYVLEIRAKQPGGYQWSKSLEFQLTVFKPWYTKTWVLSLSVGILIAFIAFNFRVYAMRRFKRLQKVLKYSNEKLAFKEDLLNKKIQELEEKGEKLISATSNIQTLELFIKEISKNSSWEDIITAMGKAVKQTVDINAFEIAFKEDNDIVHRGYSDQERSGYTFRAKGFDTKTSLTCWAMENHKEVLINDFLKEHVTYIEEKEAYRFNSLLFIPFFLENQQPVVLCAYSTQKNHFDLNDLTMFRILAQFIFLSVHQEISKKA